MPKIDPDLRAALCAFIHPNGRHCRLPHVANGAGYCYVHARKIRQAAEAEETTAILTAPIAHPAIASTSITHTLVRLFTGVACGKISTKTSNALLRIAMAMHKTIPDSTHEFSEVFDRKGLRATLRDLYEDQDVFLNRPDEYFSPAQPDSLTEEANQVISTQAHNPGVVGAEPACPESDRKTSPSPIPPQRETTPTPLTQPPPSSRQPSESSGILIPIPDQPAPISPEILLRSLQKFASDLKSRSSP